MAGLESHITHLIERGALFVINHSGGKDSQAMFLELRDEIPADQILVIHADLSGADWAGTWEHIVTTTAPFMPVKTTATKTFMEMVEHRGMWPSPKYRQCTSDLKRGPIERTIRRFLAANPRFNGLVVKRLSILPPDLECAPGPGQVMYKELTGDAGLSEDESHGKAPHIQYRIQAAGGAGVSRRGEPSRALPAPRRLA